MQESMTSAPTVSTLFSVIDGLVQNRSISIANALQILQSCTKFMLVWANKPL